MTKLTTEFLSKLQENLLQFQDSYSDPADKENCDIFVDALHMLDEFKATKEKILAYEQAAKNPIAFTEACEISNMNATGLYMRGFPDSKQGRNIPIYAAPVLPKQPELVDLSQQVEILNKILNWILKELPVPTQKASAMAIRLSSVIDIISDLELPAPAQPVIPEQTKYQQLRDIVLLTANNLIQSGYSPKENSLHPWESLLFDAEKALAAQPVSEPSNSPVIPDGSADTKRLNWLDAQNARLNEYFGTSYGWKFDVNLQRSAMILNDCNFPVMTVRQAIDEAMLAAAPAQEQK